MVLDVLRGYLQVAEGIGDVTKQRVAALAEAVLEQSSEASTRSQEQIQTLAEDLVSQGQTNRDLLIGLIRTEVDRTVGRMGFVREEELAAVRAHVKRLEDQVRNAKAAGGSATRSLTGAAGAAAGAAGAAAGAVRSKAGLGGARDEAPAPAPEPTTSVADTTPAADPGTAPETSTAKKPAAKSTAKKTTAARASATRAGTRKTAAAKSTAKKTSTAKKAGARKTAAKSTAKKTTAKKATAKRTTAAKTAAKKTSASPEAPDA